MSALLSEMEYMRQGYREADYMRLVRRNTVDLTGAPNKWDHTYAIVLAQEPTPKPAPTFMAWIANGILHRRTVNKASTKINKFRKDVEAALMATTAELTENDFPIFDDDEPVEIEIKFYRKVPDCVFVAKDRNRPKVIFANGRKYDTQRPDIDNLCKFVLDALHNVVYSDDSQVVKLTATKMVDHQYPYTGRIEIVFKCCDKKIYRATNHMFMYL
jgi:Holliday junction resolvase RusA-like endonuclease